MLDASIGTGEPKAKKARKTVKEHLTAKSPSDIFVEKVNSLDVESLKAQYVDDQLLHYQPKGEDSPDFNLTLVASDHLTPGEHNASFSLVETTSRHDYERSAFGWHPRRKRREMLEPEMRYLFVRRQDAQPSIEKYEELDIDSNIAGFLSFMITHDSSPSMPVLYIYEIHLAESLRGLGLGAHLMHAVESIAKNIGVAKVMLTCFLSNKNALGFYESHGYGKDVCSPEDRKTRNKVVKVDYVIMSKLVEGGEGKSASPGKTSAGG